MFCRRRTRQSGPLGELFDHGVDALNTSLEVLLFSAAMNFGQGWKTVLVLFGCTLLPKCLLYYFLLTFSQLF
jgi:ethanolaminephosphotransferase